MKNFLKKHILPILLIVGGVIDQSTDLLVQLLSEIGAPSYYGTIIRILIVIIGAIKLYYAQPEPLQNTSR